MSKKKNLQPKPSPEATIPTPSLNDLFTAHITAASKELNSLLQKYNLELYVSHSIQLRPKQK